MSTATTVVTPALPAKFETLEDTMNGVLFERKDEIKTSIAALIAGKHHVVVGPPGTGKTLTVDTLTKLIDGVGDHYFRWLMTRFTTPEEVLGPPSLKALENDEYRRNTANKLPEARITFLDELFRANSSILNALLTILNEGLFFNNGHPIQVPLATLFGATNELPREAELAALWDRITFRHEVHPLRDASNRKKMLQGRLLRIAQTLTPVVTWDELLQAQDESRQVTVPDVVLDKLIDLQDALKKEGVEPTDRRISDCIPIIQATAWRGGRDEADVDDLKLLRHVLWVDIKDQAIVNKTVLALANPLDKEALDLLELVNQYASEADQLLKTQDNKQKRRQQGVEIHGRLERLTADLDALESKANKGGKRSELLEEARQRVAAVASLLLNELFGIQST